MPFDFAAVSAPFRMQPGLRRIVFGALQLTPNRADSAILREKLGALEHHVSQALLAASGFDSAPALHALMQQAATEQLAAFQWGGASAFDSPAFGWRVRGDALDGDGAPEIGDCMCTLPADWRLPASLSLAPVKNCAVTAAAHLARLVSGTERWERLGWSNGREARARLLGGSSTQCLAPPT